MLSLEEVHVRYGQIHALKGISLQVSEGQIVALLGNNGAGKTTTLKAISGLLRPHQGTIAFHGARIDTVAPHQIVHQGIAHVPEGRKVFHHLTVQENLEMGAYARSDGEIGEDMEKIYRLFPRLRERRNQLAGTLSGGEQQMLAISRALMARPTLLLMDEPSLGLAPRLVEIIFQVIREIRARGTTILLVEQNAHLALSIADTGYVMETGEIVLHDTAAALIANPEIRRAYLGE